MQTRKIIQVEDKVPPRLLVPLSIQHMFAMFGRCVEHAAETLLHNPYILLLRLGHVC